MFLPYTRNFFRTLMDISYHHLDDPNFKFFLTNSINIKYGNTISLLCNSKLERCNGYTSVS